MIAKREKRKYKKNVTLSLEREINCCRVLGHSCYLFTSWPLPSAEQAALSFPFRDSVFAYFLPNRGPCQSHGFGAPDIPDKGHSSRSSSGPNNRYKAFPLTRTASLIWTDRRTSRYKHIR
uniref:Uncharacterized protein n=1 Tax=Rhizophora mucronata TaxID=61149 RepID=A0A2P2MA64_RHIMU